MIFINLFILSSHIHSLIFYTMLIFSLFFFASLYTLKGPCALADSDSYYRKSSLPDKLTTRQAAGSVPASEFVRRAFQGCKCWCNSRSMALTVTCWQQLSSLEIGSILTEVKFPIGVEGSTMSTVSAEPYGEMASPIDRVGVSNNTAFY